MAGFTTRVELHGAATSDYTRLRSEMTKEGFAATITANDGTVYELPAAEYIYEYGYDDRVTRIDVRDKASRAAARVQKSFSVFVSVTISWAWDGLKPVSRRRVG